MLGNVWEWVEDCDATSYEGLPGDGRAHTSGKCGARVLRGGSWCYEPETTRSAACTRTATPVRFDCHGFRVARTVR